MKVLLYITIFFTITLICCRNEDKSNLKNKDFILTFEFHPSKCISSRVIVTKKDNIKTVSLDFIYGNKKRNPVKTKNLKIIKNTELAMPEFSSMDYFGDSVFIERVECNSITRQEFNEFIKILGETDLLKMQSKSRVCIDGIVFCARFETDSIRNQFEIINPCSDDTSERRLINSIYSLIKSNLRENDSKVYIKILQDYLEKLLKEEDNIKTVP